MNSNDNHHSEKLFEHFLHSEAAGSIALLIATILALIWANSPWAAHYFELSHTPFGVSWGEHNFKLSLQLWINDGLMAIFFFVVGLEIKREMLLGHLSSVRQAILPVSAAIGGMLVPALLYSIFNQGGEGAMGWGIPMATDIAFALGILSFFGKRVPIGLKVFLTALAIADDLGAVLVIALFYTGQILLPALGVAGIFMILLLIAGRLQIKRPGIYSILILGVWAGVFASGLHSTVAGILVAMLVPVRARIKPIDFFAKVDADLNKLRHAKLTTTSMIADGEQLDIICDLDRTTRALRPPGITMEDFLHPLQVFIILPLFAFFNTGITFDGQIFEILANPVSIGIIVGLFFGKQIGVSLFSWLLVKTGKGNLPAGVNWSQIYGVSCLAGIGFTMSLFVSDLAFLNQSIINDAKASILVVSMLSCIWGSFILSRTLPKNI